MLSLVLLLTLSACAGEPGAPTTESHVDPTATGEGVSPTPISSEPAAVEATTDPVAAMPPGAVDVALGPGPVFTPSRIVVPAGEVIFYLHADAANSEPHNFAIRLGLDTLAASDYLDGGESAAFTVKGLAPGEYRFYCQFEDHLAEGMAGDLIVEQR